MGITHSDGQCTETSNTFPLHLDFCGIQHWTDGNTPATCTTHELTFQSRCMHALHPPIPCPGGLVVGRATDWQLLFSAMHGTGRRQRVQGLGAPCASEYHVNLHHTYSGEGGGAGCLSQTSYVVNVHHPVHFLPR